jgi:hypothetical protein
VRKSFPDDLPHEKSITLVLLQHARTMDSPIHRWLVAAIQSIVKD